MKIMKLYNKADKELEKNYEKFSKELEKSKKHFIKNKDKFKDIRNRINTFNSIIHENCDNRKFVQPAYREDVSNKKYGVEECLKSFNKELGKIDELFGVKFGNDYVLYRGAEMKKDKFLGYKKGYRGIFNTYLWVSKNPFYSSSFAGIYQPTFQSNDWKKGYVYVFYRIKVKKGSYFMTIDYDTYYPEKSNYEVMILPRGSEYIVTGVTEKTMGKTHIYFVDIDLKENSDKKIYQIADFDNFTYELL